MKKILLSIAIVFGLCGAASAQTALTQTSLASAITIGPAGGASGITGSYSTTLNLTSATGVQQAINGQPITFVYVDQELFGILTLVPGQTTIYSVLRAQLGTKASAHVSGKMALIETVSPQFGGYSGSGGFQQTDPPFGGNCTATNTLATPWVNVLTGAQWLCSTITNTWIPGFNNPLAFVSPGFTAAVTSATSITPTGPMFHLTGTVSVTTIVAPIGMDMSTVGSARFTFVCDAVCVLGTGVNIKKAFTTAPSAAGQVITLTWDPVNSVWDPSA